MVFSRFVFLFHIYLVHTHSIEGIKLEKIYSLIHGTWYLLVNSFFISFELFWFLICLWILINSECITAWKWWVMLKIGHFDVLELIYILSISHVGVLSLNWKILVTSQKSARDWWKRHEREKNVSPLSGAKEDLVVDEATKGQIGKRTDDRTEKQTQVQQKLSLSPSKYMSFHKSNIRKGSWLNKGHFWHDFRVILGSFPDQTPNRAVTAKVTFMVTYEFKNIQCRKIIYGSLKIISKNNFFWS